MKLAYRFLIFILTLMMLSVPAYSVGDPLIYSFAIAPQGDRFSVIGKIGKFILIDNSTSERVQFPTIPKQHVRIESAALSSESQWLALGTSDGSALLYEVSKLWDARRKSWEKPPNFILNEHNDEIWAIAFSPDGEWLASGGADGNLKLSYITTSTSKRQSSILLADESHSAIKVITFSPDGRTLAVGRVDGTIALWDVETRHVKKRYEGHSWEVTALAFSPNSKILASGTAFSELVLWDVSRYNELTSLEGHDGNVGAINALAFSPDDGVLASGGADRKVMLWNSQTGGKINEFTSKNSVLSVVFTADAQKLIVGDTVGEIKHMSTGIRRTSPRPDPSPDPIVLSKKQQSLSKSTSQIKPDNERKKQTSKIIAVDKLDETAPRITILRASAIDGQENSAIISGTVTDDRTGVSTIRIDDSPMRLFSGNSFQETVPLEEGANAFNIIAIDRAENTSTETVEIYRKLTSPKIEVISPQLDANNSAEIRQDQVEIKVKVTDESEIAEVKCNNKPMRRLSVVSGGGIYGLSFMYYQRGLVTFAITARDNKGSAESMEKITITSLPPISDKRPPTVEIPLKEIVVAGEEKNTYISGTVTDEHSGIKTVKIEGKEISFESTGHFRHLVSLKEGDNAFTVTATDKDQNTIRKTVKIHRKLLPPHIEVISPQLVSNSATISTNGVRVDVRVTDESGIAEVKINGVEATTQDGRIFTTNIVQKSGSESVVIEAKDKVGATSSQSFIVNFQNPQQTVGKTTPVSELERQTTTTIDQPRTSTTSNQKEKDDPEIIFRNTDLRKENPHETREDPFLLRVYIIDASQTRVRLERKVSGRYEHIVDSAKIEDDEYQASLPLTEGLNEFRITAEDEWDNIERRSFTIVKHQTDTEGPKIEILKIGNQTIRSLGTSVIVRQEEVRIHGRITDVSGIEDFKIKGDPVKVERDGSFEESIRLDYGENRITFHATDRHNHSAKLPLTIIQRLDRTNKDFALFFATQKYSGAKDAEGNWKDLVGPIRDAEAAAKSLQENYGFETRIFRDLTKKELRRTLFTYKNTFEGIEYAPGSQLLIYFSGHGVYYDPDPNDDIDGKGYLITADTDYYTADPVMETAFDHEELRTDIDAIACSRILVLLDTCDSGTFDPNFVPQEPLVKGPVDYQSLLEQIKRKLDYRARWCLTAAGQEFVFDSRIGHSPFASAFLNALNTKGGDDSLLVLDEVWNEIEKSKAHPAYDIMIEATGQTFKRPQPRRGQFSVSLEESDFLFFPIK